MRSNQRISTTSEGIRFDSSKRSFIIMLTLGIVLLLIVIVLSISSGNYYTSIKDVFLAIINPSENSQVYTIITLSRIPRLIAALFVGAALSVAGLVYQDIFVNKMASPDLLGVSAGAGCGASLAIVMGLGF